MSYIGTYKLTHWIMPGENSPQRITQEEMEAKDPETRRSCKTLVIYDNGTLNICLGTIPPDVPQEEIEEELKRRPTMKIINGEIFDDRELRKWKEEDGALYIENTNKSGGLGPDPWIKISTDTPGELQYIFCIYTKQ